MSRIYLSAPHMGGDELELVQEAFRTNWLSSVGPHLGAFERELGERLRGPLGPAPHVCALSSGTAALHLAMRLVGVGLGDEVFCPSLTFAASCNPVLYERGVPVFLDSDRTSWNLDPNVLEDALSARARAGRLPKALVVVHLYGQPADLDPILSLAARFEVPVIEDAAEALGALYRGRPVGSDGRLGILSFNGNKIITTTGGGALLSRDPALTDRARFLATQARDPGLAYEHSQLGFNYRMSNVLAGIGRGQLRVLDQRVRQRRAVFEHYRAGFSDLAGLVPMPEPEWGFSTRWLSCFIVDREQLGVDRDAIVNALAAEDIEARPVWKPMHLQALYRDAPRFGGAVAEDLFARGICLPSSSFLDGASLDRVVSVVRRAVGAR